MKYRKISILSILLVFAHNCIQAQEYDYFIKNKKSKISFVGSKSSNKKTTNSFNQIINTYFFGKKFNLKEKTKRYEIQNQTYNNIDIFSADIKINFDNKSNVILYTDNTINFTKVDKSEFPIPELISNYSNIKTEKVLSSKQIYFPISESEIIPALEIRYMDDNLAYISIFNSNYDIVYNQCLSYDKDMVTYPANASVFKPEPITSAHTIYGGEYSHNQGGTNTSLENEQVDVEIECYKINETYYLENNYCRIEDFQKPSWPVVTSDDGDFSYNRSQKGFQQVNAFYHISEMKKYLNNIGFEDAVNYQIRIDADAEEGDDNSHFTPSERQGNLTFGAYAPSESKGMEHVPDAEDAGVIIHEYAHAISNTYSDAGNQSERRCLEEAMADYFAISYTAEIDSYDWEKIFKWDGHNEFWDGRIATSSKCYSDITYFPSNDYYFHSDVWTAPLMDMYFELGKETTDKLVLHTLSALSSNTTMEQAALIMMSMDTVFNSNQNSMEIFNTFKKYCILNDGHLADEDYEFSNFKIINSQSFAKGGEMSLEFGYLFSGEVNMYDINGVKVFSKKLNLRKNINISSEYLNSGIYLINLKGSKGSKNIKLCKY